MGIDVNWISQAGKRTEDNRDWGGVGIRADNALCVLLDGSTTGPNSGELARQITRELIDWYVAFDEAVTADTLVGRLRHIHETLSKTHPRDSASYMIVHIQSPNAVLVLHAGDCLLGRCDEKSGIEWLSRPHTLANVTGETAIAAIVGSPARHRLTRSFRAREFMLPDAIATKVDGELVVSTDGFWAELSSSDQLRFMEGQDIPMTVGGDDRSVLRIRLLDGTRDSDVRCVQETPDNLYVKRTSQAAGD